MPRIGAMYAGASGSSHGINKMAVGLGNNKWQGIAPTGQKRSGVVRHIQTNAWGNNYTGVYCFNALGGNIGRISTMFAPNADGARKDCYRGVKERTAYIHRNESGQITHSIYHFPGITPFFL